MKTQEESLKQIEKYIEEQFDFDINTVKMSTSLNAIESVTFDKAVRVCKVLLKNKIEELTKKE